MKIDRKSVVTRNNPVVRGIDPLSPFSVGNGEFAMTVDFTGLQSFPERYTNTIPLGTMSNWGWHTSPNPNGYSAEGFPLTNYKTFNGRETGYRYFPWLTEGRTGAIDWLRANPHRLHLGHVGLRFRTKSGAYAKPEQFNQLEQTLDLWTGILESRFHLDDASITVRTCCHPARDMIAVQVESDHLSEGDIEWVYRFPYGSQHKQSVVWDRPEAHQTDLTAGDRHAVFKRTLDQDRYEVITEWNVPGELIGEESHHFVLKPRTEGNRFECVTLFTPEEGRLGLPSYEQTAEASSAHWSSFWSQGGFIDFGDATDPRAPELERRTVLSLYQTYINSSGSLPPQETGYVFNSWDGKFHLEMHWWHAVHFPLWGRPQLLEKSLRWYQSILPAARETAKSQGYKGVRWPKCVAPDGRQMPCYIEPFLIWQQPHPIYYSELLYRSHPGGEVLERYQELVHESALFMASFVEWDEAGSRYVLGPPVAPAQERYDHETTINPTFELEYWHFGLETAQQWRMRLGLPREEKWDHILANLSPLPVVDGVYVAAETAPDTFSNKEYTTDHPTMAASMGLLPGAMADKETMRHTYDKIIKEWDWKSAWGWDFPMMAMTAARLGMPEKAVDVLLMDAEKNRYLPNGHCFQNHSLTIYLPGNGGLLSAVAMMAAGWSGIGPGNAPGFPNDGTWKIRSEGLKTYI